MSARVGSSVPVAKVGEKAATGDTGTKAKTTPKPPLKGVVIREKRSREADHATEKGELDSSKGKEVMPPPPSKKIKSSKAGVNETLRTSAAGASLPVDNLVPGASIMSDAFLARKLLNEVIPSADRKKVDQFSENELVAKSFHALGQVICKCSPNL